MLFPALTGLLLLGDTEGSGYTVILCEVVAVQEFASVTVTETDVTPVEKVFAAVFCELPAGDHEYELPPVAVKETKPQLVVVPVIPAVGLEYIVIPCVATAVHKLSSVTVTETVVPDEKVFAAVLCELPAGDHEYEEPPVAVKETEPQPVVVPVIPAVGGVLTVIN